ncbi:hypothetical protein LCGC14_3068140, partial [marine sediment metagenome]
IIYINGTAVALTESATPDGARVTDVGSVLTIGNYVTDTLTFDGGIKNMRMYSRVLGAAEISVNFGLGFNGAPSSSTGLAGYWKLNEGTGTTATDSSVAANDGTISGATWLDGAMNDVIVSSASTSYAVYFDSGGSIFYIDMPKGLSNPNYLIGTQKYETTGIYLSPWFDGDNQSFQKLVKAVTSFAKRITANETIVIKYRVDKVNTDRDAGFTTLDTLNTSGDNGEVVNEIASGAGLGFNSFQFRLDLARGGTTTNTPDMLALTLAYRLVTQGNWSWSLNLVLDDSHNTTPAEKIANLESAIESAVDVPFIYRFLPDETHFVQFLSPREIQKTGKEFDGSINIQLLESWLP